MKYFQGFLRVLRVRRAAAHAYIYAVFYHHDICIFLYHDVVTRREKNIRPTLGTLLQSAGNKGAMGIKYPQTDRKTCDIIFVAERQMGALSSLYKLCSCIISVFLNIISRQDHDLCYRHCFVKRIHRLK